MAGCNDLLSERLRQQKLKIDEEERKEKPLHGIYHRQIEGMVGMKTYQWLDKTGRKDSTEALITAAQDQVLRT